MTDTIPEIPVTPARPSYSLLTMAERLTTARIALMNAGDDKIKGLLAEYGYTAAKLAEGQALLDAATELTDKQRDNYGDQFAATQTVEDAQVAANVLYMRHLTLARLAFKADKDAQAALALNGPRRDSQAGWLRQAEQFYNNLLDTPAYVTALSTFGRTLEELAEGKNRVAAVAVALANQAKERGEAQQATQDRNAAFLALDGWMSDFLTVARLALAEYPQLLEMVGITKRE